jgi:hypothetical protein
MRQICMSGSMSGVWKRSHGRSREAPPDERGGNRYVRSKATAPHLDSTTLTRSRRKLPCPDIVDRGSLRLLTLLCPDRRPILTADIPLSSRDFRRGRPLRRTSKRRIGDQSLSSQGTSIAKRSCHRTKDVVLRGTESLLTHRWRKTDSNSRSLREGKGCGQPLQASRSTPAPAE